jgi:CRISPR-associated protein Cas2
MLLGLAGGEAPGQGKEAGMALESWIVAYDISDPKRLRRVATACEDFGVRKQLSVFLCRLSPTDRVRLRSRLWELIDHRADQVLFIPLCARCVQGIEALGRPTEAVDARDVVIVV